MLQLSFRSLLSMSIHKDAHLERVGVSDDGFELHGVHQWFAKSDVFDAGIIEPINTIPDCMRYG